MFEFLSVKFNIDQNPDVLSFEEANFVFIPVLLKIFKLLL